MTVVTAYMPNGETFFMKNGDKEETLLQLAELLKDESIIKAFLHKEPKVTQLRIVVEEICEACGKFHVESEYMDFIE